MNKEEADKQKEREAAQVIQRVHSLIKYSGLPEITRQKCLLKTFKVADGNRAGYLAAQAFIENPEHHFLTLGGEVGRGKTHLALAIGWFFLEQVHWKVKYYQVSELLDLMRREYDNPPADSYGNPVKHILEHCKLCDLLILDDLGTEKVTEWVTEKLNILIDYRWLNELETVFTTNKLLSQLADRIRSRIKEGITVVLEGPDYREIKARARAGQKGKSQARENSRRIAE